MGLFTSKAGATGASDPILTRIVAEDKVPWYKKPNLRYLYFMLFPTCMGIEMTSGFDSQMINALQIVPTWKTYFDNPQGSLKGIIAAAYSLGAILSLPLVPIINDKFGRRWAILLGSLVQCAGAIVQCFSVHVGMYIVSRMTLGFGIPTCIVAGSSLIGELAYPKERPILTSFFNVAYFVGSIVAAAVCFGTNNIASNWAWRLPSILQCAPSLVQIAFVLFLPESPRWLISKDHAEDAYEILVKYHGEGNHDSDFVRAEMAQIRSTLQLEMDASSRSWKDMVATKGMRKRVLIGSMLGLFTQWSGNTLISYYLGDLLQMIGKTSSIFKQKLNVGLSCWNLVCAFTAAVLVTRFKRRTMYLTCTISLLLCYIAWTVSMEEAMKALAADSTNQAAGVATIFFIFMYAPCYNIGYNALTYSKLILVYEMRNTNFFLAFLVELFPFAERSRGIAIFQFFGRGAGFFTNFVNPIGKAAIRV